MVGCDRLRNNDLECIIYCLFCFFFIVEVGLSLSYCGHFWPIVQTPVSLVSDLMS
jgi:hypothetical protein